MGDIYWVNFDGRGHTIRGWHPALVVQNNLGNTYSPNLQVIPISSSMTKAKLPTHVYLKKTEKNGLAKDSIAQCEGQRTVCKDAVSGYIGSLADDEMALIARAQIASSPTVIFLTVDEMLNVLQTE